MSRVLPSIVSSSTLGEFLKLLAINAKDRVILGVTLHNAEAVIVISPTFTLYHSCIEEEFTGHLKRVFFLWKWTVISNSTSCRECSDTFYIFLPNPKASCFTAAVDWSRTCESFFGRTNANVTPWLPAVSTGLRQLCPQAIYLWLLFRLQFFDIFSVFMRSLLSSKTESLQNSTREAHSDNLMSHWCFQGTQWMSSNEWSRWTLLPWCPYWPSRIVSFHAIAVKFSLAGYRSKSLVCITSSTSKHDQTCVSCYGFNVSRNTGGTGFWGIIR